MFCVRICTLQNLVIHGAISVIHHKTIIRYCSNCMELKDKKKNKKKKKTKKKKRKKKNHKKSYDLCMIVCVGRMFFCI